VLTQKPRGRLLYPAWSLLGTNRRCCSRRDGTGTSYEDGELGRLLALVVNPVASRPEFIVCECVNGVCCKKLRTQARSRTLKVDHCVCTGRRCGRECLLLLGENIHKIKGGYCPESSGLNRCAARDYNMTPGHVMDFSTLETKLRPLYLKTQSVPRCKHFSSRL